MPTMTTSRPDEFTVSLVLAPKHGGRQEVLASGTLQPSGSFELVTNDADAFERGLALLLTARFAELPMTDFARRAAELLTIKPVKAASLGAWATRPLLSLIVDHEAATTLGIRREQAIQRSFESRVQAYGSSLLDTLNEGDEETSDAWQPGDQLAGTRDRILRWGGAEPLTSSEVTAFLGVTRTTLANWRKTGRILGLPHGSDRKLIYPRWQFDPRRPTHLVPGLATVLGGLTSREPWGIADLLTAPTPSLDGEAPIERLRASGEAAATKVKAILDAAYL